ncbi:metallophosphoesterase [Pseudaminobacter arsenicus]|uniref:Phosphoesterase n=1 Tax=Borborobacter arsenicus TaxID=1851146 RepID=A0A432UYV5_9HYPH|nr:metallophosphoesterase family protein [Pseudaminobacter arsenicus]RUM95124.1 metallophosphoesterase [Pseudaminobacter arsenicus]
MPIIGVISDTHGLLRDEAIKLLDGVDHIIHAGDIGKPEIVRRLEAIAPVAAIRGNIDVNSWTLRYPETLRLELFGRSIFVIHDQKGLTICPSEEGTDMVIFGHSHRPSIETTDGVIYLNPGSAGPRRFRLPVTLALVEVLDGILLPKIHHLE